MLADCESLDELFVPARRAFAATKENCCAAEPVDALLDSEPVVTIKLNTGERLKQISLTADLASFI